GSEKSEQVPQKKQHRCERDQQCISHLRRQTSRVVGRGFPDQPPKNFQEHAQYLHADESLLCRSKISINFQPPRPFQDRQMASRKISAACSTAFNPTWSFQLFRLIPICCSRFWETNTVAKTSPLSPTRSR